MPTRSLVRLARSLVSSRAGSALVNTPMSVGRTMTTNPASEYVTRAAEMADLKVPARIFRDVARMNIDVARHGDGATGRLSNNRIFHQCRDGETPDGFRVDVDGNLWCGWGMNAELDGVIVLSPEGKLIGRIRLPERCANLCFGGVNRNRLFMASSHSLYALYVNTQGAAGT